MKLPHPSDLEGTLAFHLTVSANPMLQAFQREYRFHPTRRWRFDFAWPELMLAAEVEGLVYVGRGKRARLAGRHVSIDGFHADCEKYNEAAILGWRVLRFGDKHINSGEALQTIDRAIEALKEA